MTKQQSQWSGLTDPDFRPRATNSQAVNQRVRFGMPYRQTSARAERVRSATVKNYLKALRAAEMAAWEAMDGGI